MRRGRRGAGRPPDVLVIGGGLAGLCAAIAAQRLGVEAALVESAPKALRGGDARHARNFRIPHAGPTRHTPAAYGEDEFLAEWSAVAGGDAARARSIIAAASDLASWVAGCGVRLQDRGAGVIPFSRRTAFLLGGGKAMMSALYETAAAAGVDIRYDSQALGLRAAPEGGWSVGFAAGETRARCVVVASGGPGANPTWLRPSAGALMFRGGAYSDGRVMQALVEGLGVRTVGDPASRHMVAVDARGPQFDGGIVTRVTAIPHGIVVNRDGAALADPSRNAKPSHYAQWGARIAAEPGGVAFLILDSEGLRRAGPMAFAPLRAVTLAGLASALGLEGAALERAACCLRGPPFFGLPLRAGLTFAHFGLQVDESQRPIGADGCAMEGLFAAGMIMAANFLPCGYLAGLGITLSAVTGRAAGEAAARHVLC
jgi:tricarballylate dehydrogenase